MNIALQLDESAGKFGVSTMLLFKGRAFSFMEIRERVFRMADGLRSLGIREGDFVSVGLPNNPDLVISLLAVLSMGGVVVPLNPVWKEKELSAVFSNSRFAAAITGGEQAVLLQELKSEVKNWPAIILNMNPRNDSALIHDHFYGDLISPEGRKQVTSSDLALVIYTSGTSGRPKGVMLSHGNILAVAGAVAAFQERDQTDCGICFFPLTHITGIVNFMVDSLVTGATFILQERFDVEDYLACFQQYRCTTMGAVHAVFMAILNHPGCNTTDFKELRRITSGGASLPLETIERLKARFGVPILEMYGMTENAATLTSNPLTRQKAGSVGVPLPGMEIRIVDEDGKTLPPGAVGEVIARGPGVMAGYLNDPERTARVLRNGWYWTGDMGRMDEDGFLYIVDRKDDMINAGAFKIYPREVEEVLYQHPAVRDCAVVGVSDERLGQAPVAFVALMENSAADENELVAFVKKRMANYKAPRRIHFLASLPRTVHGKIDKKRLKEEES